MGREESCVQGGGGKGHLFAHDGPPSIRIVCIRAKTSRRIEPGARDDLQVTALGRAKKERAASAQKKDYARKAWMTLKKEKPHILDTSIIPRQSRDGRKETARGRMDK